jgi:exodeoxyribonuclease VIII
MTSWGGGTLPTFGSDLVQMGLVSGLSNEAYHAAPGVSKSGLDRLAKSPAHYLAYLREDRKETPALRLGRIIHRAILEPDTLALAIGPDCGKRSKEDKATWAAFEAASAGCEIVTADEAEQIRHMRDAAYNHPAARRLLFAPGVAEASGWWFDQTTGELCRCRPDYLRTDGILADLKSTEDAGPGFKRSCANYFYHKQAAFYVDGVTAITGETPAGFVFVAVEKQPPYAVATYQLDAVALEVGRALYQRDLMTLAECKISHRWPGYSEQIEVLSLPGWATQGAVL